MCNTSATRSRRYPAGNGTTATGDATYTTDIPDNAGIALFNNNTGGGASLLANRLDAVGSTSEANTLYKEGTGYPALTPFSIDYTFYRDERGKAARSRRWASAPISTPKDTNNNAADFVFVDTNGTRRAPASAWARPDRRTSRRRSSATPASRPACWIRASLRSPPNRVRDFTTDPANNSTFGTLDLRRSFTNNTGGNVTRLRYRVIDLTTFPAPSGIADMRPRTSTAVVVTVDRRAVRLRHARTSPCRARRWSSRRPSRTAAGSTASMSSGTVTLATPLANGATINVRFLIGIQQTGNFKFYLNIEALP